MAMEHPRLAAWAACALAVLVAGCAGPEAAAPAAASPGVSGPSAFTGQDLEGGALLVTVVDDSLTPIAEALVAVRGLDAVLQSDASGQALFQNLAPGDYKVEAQRLGYQPAVASATVEAGATTEVSLVLEPLPVLEPYTRFRLFRGMMSCGASLVVTSVSYNCTGNERIRFDFRVNHDLLSIVDEAEWKKNNVLGADRLRLWLAQNETTVATISFQCSYAVVHGSSPIYVNFNGPFQCLNRNDPVNGGGLMTSWLRTPLELGAFAVIVEQPFTMYVTEFYGERAPEDYSARPDK